MTETNRNLREIPHIELPPFSASAPAGGGLMGLVAAVVACILIVPASLVYIDIVRARHSAAPVETSGKPCATPTRDGDKMVVVVTNQGGALITECRAVNTWREPERGLQ